MTTKNEYVNVRLVVTNKDGNEVIDTTFYDVMFQASEQRGYIEEVRRFSSTRKDFRPNGHWRLNLKLWRGCKTFDTFVANEVK